MKKLSLSSALCAAVFSFTSMPSNSALVGRLPLTPDGTDFQAAYDTVLNITWLTDAALSGNNTWANQLAWVDSLNSANHLGFND